MQRLMSWAPEERSRTIKFMLVYFVSAWFRMVIPVLLGLLIVLVLIPRSRRILFPPLPAPPGFPPSATDPTNRSGDTTLLGTPTSSPAVHRSKSEQVEEQAWEFNQTVQRFGVRVIVGGKMTGKGEGNGEVGKKRGRSRENDSQREKLQEGDSENESDGELDSDADGNTTVNPSISGNIKTQGREHVGENSNVDNDKQREEAVEEQYKGLTEKQKRKRKAKEVELKRDALVGKIAKTLQDGLGDFADAMERFANALSPPKPYPKNRAREQIALLILLPIGFLFSVVPAHIWSHVASFAIGIAFFCQPILIKTWKWFVKKVPNYMQYLDMRNSIFSRVPTNAQLTLYLLRQAELARHPLPLPPYPPAARDVKSEVGNTGIGEDTLSSTTHEAELEGADGGDGTEAVIQNEDGEIEQNGELSTSKQVQAKSKGKIIGGIRKLAKKAAVFRGDVAVEGGTEPYNGSKIDRVLHKKAKDEHTPESYPAKLNGEAGHLYIRVPKVGPVSYSTLAFVRLGSPANTETPTFHAPIGSLVEAKKSGLWIGRAVLGWAASVGLESMGVELRFKSEQDRALDENEGGLGGREERHEELTEGKTWNFHSVGRRDELFNRLIALGGQQWETL